MGALSAQTVACAGIHTAWEEAMLKHWATSTVASLAVIAALAGALWLFGEASADAKPATVVATSCSGFDADARQQFEKDGATALTGTFAPGDHVHLVVDLRGGYSWKVTGALGKKPEVTSNGPFTSTFTYTLSTVNLSPGSTPPASTTSVMSRGSIKGFARLDLELDVAKAGEGTITISRTGSALPFVSPKVAVASCKAAARPMRAVGSRAA